MTSKVYRDEPIPRAYQELLGRSHPNQGATNGSGETLDKFQIDSQTASLTANLLPPKYRAMRKIAWGKGDYVASDAKIFYEQGKFMEDFEDDFNDQVEFVRYYPTYQSMNDLQLRGYFSWRTKVRHGLIEKTSLSFVFVHIYELLNRIGVKSPEEGFDTLKNFWVAYKEIDSRINGYVKRWLKDYVIYNNLDKTLLEDFADADMDDTVLTLLNYKSHTTDEIFSALSSQSSYHLENSRFFRKYPDDVKNVVAGVYSALSDYCGKNCKNSLCERFLGRNYASTYHIFQSAVFDHSRNPKDFIYEVNEHHKYRCQNGRWSYEKFFYHRGKSRKIGALLKTIDFLMRQEYHFKSPLKAEKTSKAWRDIIESEIGKYLERQKKAVLPAIEIDVSKLQGIRRAALQIRDKLIVEEWEKNIVPEISGEQSDQENDTRLNETEYRLMQCLLYRKPYHDLVQSRGLMLSVLIDAVNEKLFEMFNDTVIADRDGRPELIEDYTDELKRIIGE
ncbi:MAG: TerB N-terminal domain-containing protein [Planctomycetaceae bacterium]|nr:TerB N-terminal domain-containing protein [Planctomycetaceae bacterium]